MSTVRGKSALQRLAEYGTSGFGWFTKELPTLRDKIIFAHKYRNEVRSGGVLSAGLTVSTSILQIDMTALDVILNGRMKAQLAALNDIDLFATAGSIGRATYSNGADASGILLGGAETAKVAVIACNTDGAGGKEDADNGAGVKIVAVVAGTATTYAAKTAPPTSVEIQAALDAATGVHAGVTGWVWLGHIAWAGTPSATIVLNRNNVLDL